VGKKSYPIFFFLPPLQAHLFLPLRHFMSAVERPWGELMITISLLMQSCYWHLTNAVVFMSYSLQRP
jgi:hypothetical protein